MFTRKNMLMQRMAALWTKIETADEIGDEYHVDLWMKLSERLEALISKCED